MMSYIVTIIFLIILSVEDIKDKEVSVPLVTAFIASSILFCALTMDDAGFPLLGTIPGLIVVVLSKITMGRIGMADGIILSGIGMCFGFVKTIGIFIVGLALTSIVGTAIVIVKKRSRSYELPFVPFLLLGTTLCSLIRR